MIGRINLFVQMMQTSFVKEHGVLTNWATLARRPAI